MQLVEDIVPIMATNLVHVLLERASHQPDCEVFAFLSDGETEVARLTYGDLDGGARALAAHLTDSGLRGERAMLVFPPGLDFITAFFGCLYSGVTAVPVYPPRSPRLLDAFLCQVNDVNPRAILTVSPLLPRLETLDLNGVQLIAIDAVDRAYARAWRMPNLREDDIALIQYTSGSTATPKGVMVSHRNLIENQKTIKRAFSQDQRSVVVGWLPLYHDMGLIGNVLQPVFSGGRAILMPPMAFLQSPVRWLECISRHHATTSGGPNFAYDLCVRRIPEERRAALDLSSWEVAFNGAEPVRNETLQRFVTTFGAAGFRSSAFYPCYGLAEATLMVSAGRYTPELATEAWQACCGSPECSVTIVDPESRSEASEGVVGEIWVSGPSVAQGYWQRGEETESTFGARLTGSEDCYLRTGDLGMILRDKLFVTGRLKDLIIVRGRNYYPSDLEAAIERSHPAFQGGMGGAFSFDLDDEERIVAIQEAVHTNGLEIALRAARAAVAEQCGLHLHEIVLIRAGTLPRTTSGKVRRAACRERYRDGQLSVLARSVTAQPVASNDELIAAATDFDSMTPAGRQAALEELLAGCAARRLGIPIADTDYDTPLIALGLDSLRAVELRNDVEELAGLSLPVGILLQGAGIREAARQLVDPPGESVEVQTSGPHFLSPGQRALWFLQALNPESSAYHIGGAARIRGALDVKALRAALQWLVDRHPALRTSFHAVDGDPIQEIHERATLDFHDADASAIAGQISAAWMQPFRLENESQVRARLFRESPESHILVLVIHHIVADYTSLQILLRELGERYAGRLAAGAAGSHIDFVQRQAGGRLLDYWLKKLANSPAPLQIPADRPRPTVPRNVRGRRFLKLPASMPDQLRNFCRTRGVTPFMALLAAFKVLLHRYTGERDLIVGTPVNARTAKEFDTIGYRVNPVALRTNVDPTQTFEALLGLVKQTALEAFEHQDYPFGALVERLASARSDTTPVFQTMFIYHRASAENPELPAFALGIPGAQGRLGALELESVPVEGGHAQFDLSLSVADMKNDIDLSFDYNADIFDAVTIDRMLGHFANLLQGTLADPTQAIAGLPLLADEERQRILHQWNGHRIPLPNACVQELFEAQVRRSPDREALVQGQMRWSYRELNLRANRLAHRLRREGVGPEVTVGIFLNRTPYLAAALLAVWKAGGAYVPLDPSYPRERLRFALEDAAPLVVISETPLLERLSSSTYTGLIIDLMQERDDSVVGQDGILRPIGNRSGSDIPDPTQADYQSAAGYHPAPHDPLPLACPDNLAYLIYTSGSTGRPKAVAMAHRGAVTLLEWAGREFSAAEMAGVLASTSINFDLSIFELFAPLCHGGKIILAASSLDLPALVERAEVTLLNTVPSVMRELLDAGGLPETLHVVNLAGEVLSGDLAQRVRRHAGVRRLLNLYGPSESATYSTFAAVDAANEGAPGIGRPLPNVQTYVLDEWLNPVPVGAVGELFVAGDGLARGYFRRPDTTAERFIPNPFADGGARMYRTGDLARFRSDGNLDYLGRGDYQVKVRGFRIEPGEIETALRECDNVADAVVVARDDPSGQKQLIGYFVPRSAPAPALASLISVLRDRLPVYMVPAMLVPLPSFPLTPNGKLDRQALPSPDWTHAGSRPAVQPEYSPTERIVAGLWSELLPVRTPGLDDDFFALGGHSLMAARLASRLRDTFQIAIPLRRLFEYSTLKGMAAEIEKLRTVGDAFEIIPRLAPDELPQLSFAQERMWVQQALAPENPAYHMPGGIRLSGSLNVNALRASLEQVIRRHETLRSRVPVWDGQPRLAIMDEPPDVFSVVDLSGLPPAQRELELQRIAQRYATLPFDFVTGPLLRVALIQEDATEHILIAVLHHFVADGWSLEVLRRDLAKYYDAFLSGARPTSVEPAIRYRDYAAWQRVRFKDEHIERETPRRLELPTDRPRQKVAGASGARVPFKLPRAVFEKIVAFGRAERVTPFMTLFAALSLLFYRYSGQRVFVVGTPIANRLRREFEDLIGLFVTLTVVRADLEGDPTVRELLERTRRTTLDAYADRGASGAPLFQTAFALETTALEVPAWEGLKTEHFELYNQAAKYDLAFMLNQGETISGWIEYNADLFDRTTIVRMEAQFRNLLGWIVENGNRRISEGPVLSEAERQQLALEWNDTQVEQDSRSYVERIEEQARLRPDARAVSDEGGEVTFGELNERANRLARRLVREGVCLETPVGVVVDRGVELVIAWLAVGKAGGAYVAVGEGVPRARWEAMVVEAKAPLLVSQRHRAEGYAGRVVWMEEEQDGGGGNLGVRTSGENLAYVIFTSGSTGVPKGVAVEHRGLSNLIDWHGRVHEVRVGDRASQVANAGFDAAGWEIWPYLAAGASVRFAGDEQRQSPAALVEWLGRERVTHCFLPTPLAEAALEEDFSRTGVRVLLTGGDRLRRRPPGSLGRPVWNHYGPTESTVVGTWGRVNAEGEAAPDIGGPIANTRAYVLDERGALAPMGVIGELYLGGAGLARGYLGNPGETAERFVPDAVSGKPGQRLYRTGDMVKWGRDGRLVYVGRGDEQVKLRGYRIELGEVEAQLGQLEGVGAVAVVLKGEGDRRRLAAYVVGNGVEGEELRAKLRERLPDYMVPGTISVLDELPVTSNGKIDRAKLAKLEDTTCTAARLRGPIEEAIADFWFELIGRLPASDDLFFNIGGHSLLAARLAARIQNAFQIEFSLADVFEKPTVSLQASHVETALGCARAPFSDRDRTGPARISLLQERLWFLAQIDPTSTAYHVNVAVRLTGTLRPGVLSVALNNLVRRHEILRTTFANTEDDAIQIVHSDLPSVLPVIDIEQISDGRDDACVRKLASEYGSRPFNPASTPPWRAALVRESESEWVLLLCMHHMIGDAWSLAVFAKELSLLYSASVDRRTAALPAPMQYAAFSEWHRQRFEDGLLRVQLEWWKRQLAGPLTEIRLFPGRKPETSLVSRGASCQRRFGADLSELLRALSRNENSTLFMTLLAGFKTLLYCYSGQEDVIVGTDMANRDHLEAESAIGFFVNTVVLRTDLKSNPDFREVLRRVRDTALGAYAHRDTPFHQIVQAVNPARDAGRNPLFQVLFLLQNAPEAALEITGVRATPLELGHDSAAFDLSVLAQETPEGEIVVVFRYDIAKFGAGEMARMARDFERILSEATLHPETRLAEFCKIAGEGVIRPVDPKPKALRGLEGLAQKAAAPQQFQAESLVKTRLFEPGRKLPLIVEPALPEIDTVPWLRQSREWIEARLAEHGGILFRGFHVDSAEQIEGFAREMCNELIEYGERSSPRTSIQGRVYSSTDHPPDQRILLHCEQSYTLEWPMRIWFCCLQPALRGGRTPIASMREITRLLDPRVLDEFSARGVMYVRNYGGGLGLPWQDAFQTSDRQGVERYCRQASIDFEWRSEERLRTRQVRPALRKHPSTAERLWFNHALFFHVSSLDPETRESILAGVPEDELPFNTYYGDGGRIEESELQPIRDAYRAAEFSFDWQRGDVLALDNMLVAHGREAFEGVRKIVVAMGDPYRAPSGAAGAV